MTVYRVASIPSVSYGTMWIRYLIVVFVIVIIIIIIHIIILIVAIAIIIIIIIIILPSDSPWHHSLLPDDKLGWWHLRHREQAACAGCPRLLRVHRELQHRVHARCSGYQGCSAPITQVGLSEPRVCLLAGCLTSQQQASVSQGWICSNNLTCCHTEIEVAEQTFYLTQS